MSLSKGIHRTPSLGEDGELSECVNLIPKAGELVALQEPTELGIKVLDGDTLKYVHPVAKQKNYFFASEDSNNSLIYYDSRTGEYHDLVISNDTIAERCSITSMGNVLIVRADNNIHYYLFKDNEYSEKDIRGTELLKGKLELDVRHIMMDDGVRKDPRPNDVDFHYSHVTTGLSFGPVPGSDSNDPVWLKAIAEAWQGRINLAKEKAEKSGCASSPMFIRWGVKLNSNDNLVTNLTPPILVFPSSHLAPVPYCYEYTANNKTGIGFGASLLAAKPYFRFDASALRELGPEIVQGIVIFATPLIEFYSLESDDFYTRADLCSTSVIDYYGQTILSPQQTATSYGRWNIYYSTTPKKSISDLSEAYNKLSDPSNFYELTVIPYSEIEKRNFDICATIGSGLINTEEEGAYIAGEELNPILSAMYDIKIIDNYRFAQIEAQTPLSSYNSSILDSFSYTGDYMYVYNNRLLISNVKKQPGITISADNCLPATRLSDGVAPYEKTPGVKLYIGIENNKELQYKTLEFEYGGAVDNKIQPLPFYAYPNQNAKEIILQNRFGYLKGALKASLLGDCSTGLCFSEKEFIEYVTQHLYGQYDISPLIAPIYVSDKEVEWDKDNYSYEDIITNMVLQTYEAVPWAYKAAYTSPVGEILGMTSATKAISEGQFGNFPVLLFGSEGVWALPISNEGEIEFKNPLSRITMLDNGVVLQLDDAVVFPSSEGLILLQGSETTKLSASIEGAPLEGFEVPGELISSETLEFNSLLKYGREHVYDAANKRLHIFTEDYQFIRTKETITKTRQIQTGVNKSVEYQEVEKQELVSSTLDVKIPTYEQAQALYLLSSTPPPDWVTVYQVSDDCPYIYNRDSTINVDRTKGYIRFLIVIPEEMTTGSYLIPSSNLLEGFNEIGLFYSENPITDASVLEKIPSSAFSGSAYILPKDGYYCLGIKGWYLSNGVAVVTYAGMEGSIEIRKMTTETTYSWVPVDEPVYETETYTEEVIKVDPKYIHKDSEGVPLNRTEKYYTLSESESYDYGIRQNLAASFVIGEPEEGGENTPIEYTQALPEPSDVVASVPFSAIKGQKVEIIGTGIRCFNLLPPGNAELVGYIGREREGANFIVDAIEGYERTQRMILVGTTTDINNAYVRVGEKKVTQTIVEHTRTVPDAYYKHYVYSLETGEWATQILNEPLKAVVPTYPLTTLQLGNKLYQYDKSVNATDVKDGWLLTRPIAMGNPVAHKMLNDLRVLGQKTVSGSQFKVSVYISNDRKKWYKLRSLKGQSAKWYRFLVKTKMTDLDTLSGIVYQFVERYQGKMR